MTKDNIEKAIEFFEVVKRNNDADAMEHFGPMAWVEMARQYRMADAALYALKEARERMKGCEWCHEDLMMENNYCSSCGRRLATNEDSSEVREMKG